MIQIPTKWCVNGLLTMPLRGAMFGQSSKFGLFRCLKIAEEGSLNISASIRPFWFSFGDSIQYTQSNELVERQIKRMTLKGTRWPRPRLRFLKIAEEGSLIISAPNTPSGAKFTDNIDRTCIYKLLEGRAPIPETQRVSVIGQGTLSFSG